jgi:glycosyltransferase involved in cell wall biosynthesis
MGSFESSEFEKQVLDFVESCGLGDYITFLGTLAGEEKHEAFASADLFCFPTYYGPETFGVVLIEAMSFALPVVATRWRGIPGIVEEGVSGFLVPIKDAAAVAAELEKLILDPVLRRNMGAEGRRLYLEKFTADAYRKNLKQAFELISRD